MATVSRDSSSSQHQPQLQATSAEDEALKRNTDCVYFLASPLTCKKGSECEYRHSEEARINPRDCYYWLNGNCLNPKCAFRHPPLDGLLGAQAVTPSGPSLPSTQSAVPYATYNPGKQVAATNAPFNPGKQAVPCIFFFKGLCVKGDRCAFSHGLNHLSNKFTREPAAAPVCEPPNLKKATSGGLQKCSNEQKAPQANMLKSNHEVASNVKPAPKLETAASKNRFVAQKSVRAPGQLNDKDSIHRERNFFQVTNGNNTMVWSNHVHQTDVSDDRSLPNGSKDADDFYKESSPGFDVLVDDELRDSEYYHDEDQFGRRGGHEGRNLTEFDVGGSSDYNLGTDIDGEMFVDPHAYDLYDRKQEQHDRTQRRDDYSSDWKTSGPAPLEKRGYRNSVSPNQVEESDLRYRLSNQRRVSGLKSVISKDYAPRSYNEERRYRDSGDDDSRHLRPNESSLGSRLKGRISIPSRSLPINDGNLRSDRDLDRERNISRYSPVRSQSSSHQGRLQDRLKGRVQDNFQRRDRMSDSRNNFSGPKSLAELKVSKNGERREKQMEGQDAFSLGKRKNMRNHQPSDDDLSFDGPKPLSEILKRKRAEIEPQISVENVNPSIETELTHDQSLVTNVTTMFESEEGVEDNDEFEPFDENEADLDEADYTLEEVENAYPEEEYLEEDEDGDDFAKKIGVMFS